jgi:hypothetical protein
MEHNTIMLPYTIFYTDEEGFVLDKDGYTGERVIGNIFKKDKESLSGWSSRIKNTTLSFDEEKYDL